MSILPGAPRTSAVFARVVQESCCGVMRSRALRRDLATGTCWSRNWQAFALLGQRKHTKWSSHHALRIALGAVGARFATSFADRKARTLAKSDKSSKGSVDAPVVELLALINARDSLFTTSSCSGRSYLWQGLSVQRKRAGLERFRETHDVPGTDYLELTEEHFAQGWWWLRFEPYILHVRCIDLETAGTLARIARGAGVKNVAIETFPDHPLISLRGEDMLEMPVVMDGVSLLTPEQSPLIMKAVQEKFRSNTQRLERLEAALRELSDEFPQASLTEIEPTATPNVGSYESVGHVVILRRRFDSDDDASDVADQLLRALPWARTVAVPNGSVEQHSRAAPLRVIKGEHNLRTQHSENGIKLDIDLERCFFSPAMSLERRRIASMIKPGETVLELFSGVGAQAILAAHKTRPASGKHVPVDKGCAAPTTSALVDCVEMDATVAELCHANLRRNNAAAVARVFQADARTFVAPEDRADGYDVVLCPRPEIHELQFLAEAARFVRPGGRLHWYFCGTAAELDVALRKGLREVSEDGIRTLQELSRRRAPRRSVGSKGRYRWCVDFEVFAAGGV